MSQDLRESPPHEAPLINTRTLGVAIVSCAVAGLSAGLPVAAASPPLYCNAYESLDAGCPPPTTWMHLWSANEGRNESGGYVTVQEYTSEFGYSGTVTACCGNVASIPPFGGYYGFPKVWNSSNATDLIHGRAS